MVVDEVELGVFADDDGDEDEADAADSFTSSSTSLAWSAATVDSADDTASLSAVVSSVPKV